MKPRSWLATAFVELLVQVVAYVLMPLLLMGCFFFFDLFHITQTWLQVTLVVSPLLIALAVLWRFKEVIQRQNAPSTIAYDEAKAKSKAKGTRP